MSAGRRASLLALLIACAALATTASGARAQMGGDVVPSKSTVTAVPLSVAGPAVTASLSSSGLPFQLGLGMATTRWLMMGRFGTWTRMSAPARTAQLPAWWRRRS